VDRCRRCSRAKPRVDIGRMVSGPKKLFLSIVSQAPQQTAGRSWTSPTTP
jgi:hypothetical protein